MEDIWQQFHRLPKTIRDSVATPEALATVDQLERQHPGLDLAGFIMRAMVKEFPINELSQKMSQEAKLDQPTADAVTQELTAKVFGQLREYLGLPAKVSAPTVIPPTPPPAPVQPKTVPPIPTAVLSPLDQPKKVVPAPPIQPLVPLVTTMAAPRPATMTNVAPTQNYSEDDDQEIAQQARRVKDIAASSETIDLDTIVEQVMRQHNLAFRDELLQKRVVSLLKARLKGIRDSDDTKAMLMRTPKVGGLGLDPDVSANVVTSLDQAAGRLKTRGAVTPPLPIAPPPPPVVPRIEPERPAPKPPLTRGLPPENLPLAASTPLPNVTDQPRPAPLLKRPADIPAPPPIAAGPAPFAPSPRPTAPANRPLITRERLPERQNISDITRPNIPVMGPAGEMSSLTLMEFRRLGQGASDSANRLLEKFKHYQKESFPLWAEAIAGWRQSEVHRIYLDMGRQSLDQGTPITQVIQQRAKSGLPYLSEHEFAIVSDLNRQLQL